MPPVTKAGGSTFRKDVEFAATEKDEDDEYELRAAGIVMVPDKVDLQYDFAREETIRGFADQFAVFEEAGQAGGGIMHAVFPDGWMVLERNEVLDEAEEIGGQTVDAGAWIQEWGIENADLAELIEDGILSGYSIGAIQVDWGGPYEQDELDDVEVPDEIEDDALVWELTDGTIREVSAVDIPAVPDAQILEAKALEKRLGDYLGNRDGFIEEAVQRGHSEADAERLWDVLNEAVEVEGSAEPGKQSMFAKAGKAFLSALTGSDDDGTNTNTKTSEAPDRDAEKEGRTLSTANQHALFASIDASLDILQDAGVDHGMTRFTDREDTDFDLSEHTAREWPEPDDDEEDEEDSDATDAFPDSMTDPGTETESETESAAGGDTPDDGGTEAADTTMTDDTPDEEPPEWAKDLQEQMNEQSKRIDEIAGDSEEAKSEETSEDAWEDAPEWAKDLKEDVDKQAERIDAISKQTGTDTQQLGKGAEEETGKDSGFTLDPRKARGN